MKNIDHKKFRGISRRHEDARDWAKKKKKRRRKGKKRKKQTNAAVSRGEQAGASTTCRWGPIRPDDAMSSAPWDQQIRGITARVPDEKFVSAEIFIFFYTPPVAVALHMRFNRFIFFFFLSAKLTPFLFPNEPRTTAEFIQPTIPLIRLYSASNYLKLFLLNLSRTFSTSSKEVNQLIKKIIHFFDLTILMFLVYYQ